MTRPTTNMPMSGMSTRMPFPASAPRTLQRDKHTCIQSLTISPLLPDNPCLTPLPEPEADVPDRSKTEACLDRASVFTRFGKPCFTYSHLCMLNWESRKHLSMKKYTLAAFLNSEMFYVSFAQQACIYLIQNTAKAL